MSTALMGSDPAFDRREDFYWQKAPGTNARFIACDQSQIVIRLDEAVQFTRHNPRRRGVEAQPPLYCGRQFHGVQIIRTRTGDRGDLDAREALLVCGDDNDRAGTDLSAFFRADGVLITPQIGIRHDKAQRWKAAGSPLVLLIETVTMFRRDFRSLDQGEFRVAETCRRHSLAL